MAKVITVGIQKGGSSKSTTTCMSAWLLAQKHRVLVVDFDSQGNSTQILTQQDIYQFEDKTVLNAILSNDPRRYTVKVSDNLHVLPSDDILVMLPDQYQGRGNVTSSLRDLLMLVNDDYDYILIDTPPNLGVLTTTALTAADYVVVVLQTEPLCWKALDRYLELLRVVKNKTNPNLTLLGILLSMQNSQAALDASIMSTVRNDYEDLVFKTTIKRRSRIKEFTLTGITDKTAADRTALSEYRYFVKELLDRVKEDSIR